MARHINGRVLVVAVAVTALAAAGVHLVHGYQVRRHAQAFLARADEAERAGDLARCADDLRQYLAYVPADADACGRLGDVLDRGGRTRAERWQAFAALEKAVRLDPGRHDLRRQLVRVAMTP